MTDKKDIIEKIDETLNEASGRNRRKFLVNTGDVFFYGVSSSGHKRPESIRLLTAAEARELKKDIIRGRGSFVGNDNPESVKLYELVEVTN